MGMYTGLRFKAKLNMKGLKAARILTAPSGSWKTVKTKVRGLDLDDWLTVDRCDLIPRGAICYMPKDWSWGELDPEVHHYDTEEVCFAAHINRLEDGVWVVSCSLKNYAREIDQFLLNVLPQLIAEPCTAEYLYEENDEPTVRVVRPLHPKGISASAKAPKDHCTSLGVDARVTVNFNDGGRKDLHCVESIIITRVEDGRPIQYQLSIVDEGLVLDAIMNPAAEDGRIFDEMGAWMWQEHPDIEGPCENCTGDGCNICSDSKEHSA